MNHNAVYSCIVRSGKTTYFVDVKEAKNRKKYLALTENRLDSDDRKERATIRVFAESIEQFRQAITEAATATQ